jgi:hypothetical protein
VHQQSTYYRLETFLLEGSQGNDLMDYSKEQVITDILDPIGKARHRVLLRPDLVDKVLLVAHVHQQVEVAKVKKRLSRLMNYPGTRYTKQMMETVCYPAMEEVAQELSRSCKPIGRGAVSRLALTRR